MAEKGCLFHHYYFYLEGFNIRCFHTEYLKHVSDVLTNLSSKCKDDQNNRL